MGEASAGAGRPASFPTRAKRLSFAELDARANRVAQWLIGRGLQGNDRIALLLENRPEAIELAWAARRAGLYYVLLNTHLKPHELEYVLRDSGAGLLLTSRALSATVPDELRAGIAIATVDGPAPGCADFAAGLAAYPAPAPLPERPVGREFMYSSGTSGFPKGIMRPLQPASERGKPAPGREIVDLVLAGDETGTYLSPAPFYHAAPHGFSMSALGRGMTVVMLRRFDPERALAAIEQYKVTHSQWVPTMFVRLLALPEETRRRYDLSSHRRAIHAAAPCPVHVKERMIDWWGGDHRRILRRIGERRADLHRLRGLAGAQGLGRPPDFRHASPYLRPRRDGTADGRGRRHLVLRLPGAVRLSQRTGQDAGRL